MTSVVEAAPAGTRRAHADSPSATGPGWFARHPAWPISALLIGYPVWWALGLADFTWVFLAIPMAARLVAWKTRGTRQIRVPPGFGIWMIFLVIAALGIAAITATAPGTIASPVSHRILSYTDRMANYAGVTVMLLYAGNLTERELPRRRFAWMLGLLGLVTVIGGLAGMAMPHFQFNSPFLLLLPHSFRANAFVQASMHPGLSQVQNVLGSASGRPKAPFDYTNTWSDCLTILLPFLVVGWWQNDSRRTRLIAGGALAISIVPLLYSLNRGAWVGAIFSILYLAGRFAAKGKTALLGGLAVLLLIGTALFFLTPLQGIVSSRLHHGRSNSIRSSLSALTITDALASPVIGYGDTRQRQGSAGSIAVGPSAKCPNCGQQSVGSTGQLWLVLVSNGIAGAIFYIGFFAFAVWRYRHDPSPYAWAGILAILLSFIYMFTYDAVGAPLGLTMLIFALMWKNGIYQRQRPSLGANLAALAPGSHPVSGLQAVQS